MPGQSIPRDVRKIMWWLVCMFFFIYFCIKWNFKKNQAWQKKDITETDQKKAGRQKGWREKGNLNIIQENFSSKNAKLSTLNNHFLPRLLSSSLFTFRQYHHMHMGGMKKEGGEFLGTRRKKILSLFTLTSILLFF